MKRRDAVITLAAIALTPFSHAQAKYPAQLVKLVAPFPPGGTVDILSRALADTLGRELGQAVIVDNRGGAGGTIGADFVSKASPDGYTVLFGAVHHAIAQSVYPKLGYDIRKMVPIGLLGRVNHAVIVTNSLPAKNVQELVNLLKASPEKYSYATPGPGTMQHLMTELFKSVTGTSMTHIPYRGSGPAMVDLIAGNTQVMFETMPSALQHIRAGSVRAIAVTGSQRSGYLPTVPTIAESGTPNYDATSWYGLFAPAGTPAPVVDRLNQAINAVFGNKKFREQWIGLGADPGGGAPEQLAKLTASEVDRWAAVAKKANITV
jgi:tripartite-type tricarboxylate transporter receptor subunit TctC